jgi:hypothetical protein
MKHDSPAAQDAGGAFNPREDGDVRVRAGAAGLSIRIVFVGYTLGPSKGQRERFDSVEALVARLDEIEAERRHR